MINPETKKGELPMKQTVKNTKKGGENTFIIFNQYRRCMFTH